MAHRKWLSRLGMHAAASDCHMPLSACLVLGLHAIRREAMLGLGCGHLQAMCCSKRHSEAIARRSHGSRHLFHSCHAQERAGPLYDGVSFGRQKRVCRFGPILQPGLVGSAFLSWCARSATDPG